MDEVTAAVGGLALIAGSVGVTLTITTYRQKLADLRRQLAEALQARDRALADLGEYKALSVSPKFTDLLHYQRRKDAESLALLIENSARDNLDALGRLSPEHLRRVLDGFVPNLKG